MTRGQKDRWFDRAMMLIVATGIGLRLVRFLADRPLWLDETLVALNVLTRPPHQYLQPLDSLQIVPLGFLWGEWLVTRLAGNGEMALRFLPLAAGALALIAFAKLARRLLDPGAALLATALAAISPLLIYYSSELKSYGFDFLGALVVMHCTLDLLPEPSPRAWMRWGAAAAFSALFSTAAPFYVAGSAIVLLTTPPVRANVARGIRHVIAAGTPAALIVGLHLATVYRSTATTSFMQEYWSTAFLGTDAGPIGIVRHAARLARDLWSAVLFADGMVEMLPRKTLTLLLVLSIAGAIALGRRSLPFLGVLIAAAVPVLIAAASRYWPLTPRLLLFVVPAVLITLAAGVAAAARLFPHRARAAAHGIVSAAIVVASLIALRPAMTTDSRFVAVPDALRALHATTDSNTTIYISADVVKPCRYYLMWHPDRRDWSGATVPADCTIGRARMVHGEWPRRISTGAAPAPDWLQREGRRLLDSSGSAIRVVLGQHVYLDATFPGWLDSAGLTRTGNRAMRGIRIYDYRHDGNQPANGTVSR